MSTNPQKSRRKTKQVRIEKSLHKELKVKSAIKEITISRLLDKICKDYFKKEK